MANTNSPYGFRPVGKVGQNADNQGQSQYEIADDYATSIFQGDLVSMASTGYIAQAGVGDIGLGVFWGAFITKDPSTGKPKFTNYYSRTNVATGERIDAFVYDDPYARFQIQSDGATAQDNVGNLFDIAVGTGSTTNGQSANVLDHSTAGTSTGQLKLIGFSKDPDNVIGSAYVNCIVTINEHFLKQVAGV
jgi:hypothetical protein